MCGIFGITLSDKTGLSGSQIRRITRDLMLFSESRGKEASGLAVCTDERIFVFRSALPASSLVCRREYLEFIDNALDNRNTFRRDSCTTIIGHSRMATDGSQYDEQNNQPVTSCGMVTIHNGIVVNNDDLWKMNPGLRRKLQIDTEIIPALLRQSLNTGTSIANAVRQTFGALKGMASIAALFKDRDALLLATNSGSLYTATGKKGPFCMFASEKRILSGTLEKQYFPGDIRESVSIDKIEPGTCCIVDLNRVTSHVSAFTGVDNTAGPFDKERKNERAIIQMEGIRPDERKLTRGQLLVGLRSGPGGEVADYLKKAADRFPYDTSWSDSLRRCSRCILPETMPFIRFDDRGVCNYCVHYTRIPFKGKNALLELADRCRRNDGGPDCVVGISGGRDSLYSLHYVRNVLHLNPVAYTYDWGMVTDLARRNISRICGQLGIEHILVSADISRKRNNIRRNVLAWLKRPHPGMVPLFMAGDKQYYYYLSKVKKQVGAPLCILGENMLERTDFKTGFAGIPPHGDPEHVYTLPLKSKLQMLLFYGGQYLRNPAYLNGSVLDTLWAAASYYALDRDYLNLFSYVPWIEQEVNETIINDYGFECANDTCSTWRIGDGTAAFYNYIYYMTVGFTENDTFRSNQIREGLLSRAEALRRVREENKPRFETMYWYFKIIEMEIPLEKALERIGAIQRIIPQH
jgi:predicted glutamine amidotransferase